MQNVLAIDFGTKRIGLAISRGTLAEPLVVIENDSDTFNKITAIIRDEKITQLVVGISEGEMADLTRDFVQDLEEAVGGEVPIDFADETLSSVEVQERLKEKGIKQSVRSGPIDHFAAALILESWLETTARL